MTGNTDNLKPATPPKVSQRKYFPTDFIDSQIRKFYAARLAHGRKGSLPLRELSKKVGWPKHALVQRARKLGLCRVKEKHWSEAELEILSKFAHRNLYAIQKHLKTAGFHRTPTAIHVKLTRLHFRQGTSYLSATGVARLLGSDQHLVTRWIKLGYLKAARKDTNRTPQQGGDSYLIHEANLRAFLLSHPTEYDLRRVTDPLWFLDIVTDGKVGDARTDDRLRDTAETEAADE